MLLGNLKGKTGKIYCKMRIADWSTFLFILCVKVMARARGVENEKTISHFIVGKPELLIRGAGEALSRSLSGR
jgi:hypothetical protein